MGNKAPTPVVGCYERISSDQAGLGVGVGAQTKDTEALCDQHGWQPKHYTDNDTSASEYNGGKKRPGYEAMMADLASGAITGVVVTKLDRLYRQPIELEQFIKAFEASGAQHFATLDGDNLTDGLTLARIKVTLAAEETRRLSGRIRRGMDRVAAEGRPSTGGFRKFGYRPDGDTLAVVDEEAKLIRGAYTRLIGGENAYSIVREWNSRGVTNSAGNPWNTTTFGRTFVNPSLAGLRVHRGEVVGQGNWPAILTPEEHETLKAKLTPKKGVKPTTNQHTGRVYLLSGLLTCGKCGGRMIGHREARAAGGPVRLVYKCASKHAEGTARCGLLIALEPTDEYVRALVLETVLHEKSKALGAALKKTQKATDINKTAEHLAAARERLTTLENDYYSPDNTLSAEKYKKLRLDLEEAITADEAALMEATVSDGLKDVPLTEAGLEKAWKTKSLEWKRALVDRLFSSLTVQPNTSASRRYPDPVEKRLTFTVREG